MSLFDQYLKEMDNTESINESSSPESKTEGTISKVMAHIQKFVYIQEANSSWPNSIFGNIYNTYCEFKDIGPRKTNEILNDISILDNAYAKALEIIKNEKPTDIKIIPSARPSMFTYNFLLNYDQVRDYLLQNAKNHSFDQSVIKQCETYKNKRVN